MIATESAATQMATPARRSGLQLELRWRLSLVIGLLLTAALTVAAVLAVGSARVAVLREVSASLHTATASLDLALGLLEDRGEREVESALKAWTTAYADGRHLCVSIELRAQPSYGCAILKEASDVPAWFARGAESAEPSVVRDVNMGVHELRINLVTDPRDELREAWLDVRGLLLLMGVLAFAVNLFVFLAVSRGLKPLQRLMMAMDQIGRGHPAPELPRSGSPEVQVLSEGLAELAARIGRAREQVRSLHLRNLDLQEEERSMVARELHDEIGQHVAAIEMETIRIARMKPDDETHRQSRLLQLRSSVAEIHRISRRLVHRLRPPSIESLGLSGALEALFDRWRAEHPEPELISELDPACDQISAERAVHLYRIVQESLSNAARHAQARMVWVRVKPEADEVYVQVMDDGRGFDAAGTTRGFGLVGMRERVEALAGTLAVRSKAGAGTIIEAFIPWTPAVPSTKHSKRDLAGARGCGIVAEPISESAPWPQKRPTASSAPKRSSS
ncbi:MAG: sensor histidine kinase [Panacagrimonas sp.]